MSNTRSNVERAKKSAAENTQGINNMAIENAANLTTDKPPTKIEMLILAELAEIKVNYKKITTIEETMTSLSKEIIEFKTSITARFEEFKTSLKFEFHDKLNILPELKESINFISAEYVDLRNMFTESLSTIKSLQSENDQLKIKMRDLNARVTHMEQLARETNVEIQCVPEHKTENLASIVKILGTVISRPIADSEILAIHRVPKVKPDSSRPKSIIVKLPSLRARDEILAAASNFNKKNKTNKLNSAHLGINGVNSPIYVSEHLTPENKALHAATRIRAKEVNYRFVWIRNGRILVRKDENTAHVLVIRNHDSLASLT